MGYLKQALKYLLVVALCMAIFPISTYADDAVSSNDDSNLVSDDLADDSHSSDLDFSATSIGAYGSELSNSDDRELGALGSEAGGHDAISNDGWIIQGGDKFYYVDGLAVYGEQQIDGKWYHFDEVTGAMSTGLTDLGYKTVLYGADGAMLYGRQEWMGSTYFLAPETGSLSRSGWFSDGSARFYLVAQGEPARGELKVSGRWYHFGEETGAMSTGLTDLGYKTVLYGEDGAMLYGRQEYRGKVYYLDPINGSLATSGWVSDGGSRCYLLPSGELAKGERKIGGEWYHFDEETGAMSTGFTELESKTVCYAGDGAMLYGEQKIGGKWYHFDGVTGAMSTGMTDLGYKTVLYGEDGAMLYGRQEYRGKVYYLDPINGSLVTSR